jgi:hypothetical protein
LHWGNKESVTGFKRGTLYEQRWLRVLVLASRQCQQQQGEIVLAALPPFLQKVFKITHFDALFKVYATVPAALAHLSPTAASLYSAAE